MSITRPRVELGGWEDWYGWNIIYKNSKLYSLQGWILQKIQILWKKGSSKSFLKLNPLQKSQSAYVYLHSKWSQVARKIYMVEIL